MMTDSVESGVPGLVVEPGDHVCVLYVGVAERDEVLLPYIREGLRAGDKCFAAVDTTDLSAVLTSIGDGSDVADSVASQQLVVRTSTETAPGMGGLSIEDMLGFWDETVAAALSGDQFDFARVGGEASWLLHQLPGIDELIRYESELNRITPRHPQCFLCLYDLSRFGGKIVADLLETHPKLLLGGRMLDNPYYLTPDEFLASRQ